MYTPMIIEKGEKGVQIGYDIYSRLLKDRIIFLGDEINGEVAGTIIAQMLYLDAIKVEDEGDIKLFIMSPGGEVSAGMAIYDTMQFTSKPISTYCIGEACSMAALLLAGGNKGKRYILPSARVMIHQPWGHAAGSSDDICLHAEEIKRMKALICQKFAFHTGKSVDQIENDSTRDFFMTPDEAVEYGIVDKIISSKKLNVETSPKQLRKKGHGTK
jgi:ATP-dependent Clp protease protease subunit